MKKLVYTCFVLLLSMQLVIAQEYSITPNAEEMQHGEIGWKGYSVLVSLDQKQVKNGLKDAMKDFGKIQNAKKMWIIDPANVPLMGQGNVLATYDKENKNTTKIWLSINQEGDFQDEITRNTLYELAYKLYEADLNEQLSEAKKEQEKLMKEGENLIKKLDQANKNIEKAKDDLKGSEKEVKNLKSDLSKTELERDKLKLELESASEGKKKEKLQKNYDKAVSSVLNIQKKLTKEEEKQLDDRKTIRDNEIEIKDLEKEQKDNKKAQKDQSKVLEELNAKMAELMKLKRA